MHRRRASRTDPFVESDSLDYSPGPIVTGRRTSANLWFCYLVTAIYELWETDCRKGNATFAFGQALFAAIGIASAVYTAWPRPTANAHGHCRVSRHLASGTACLSRDAGRPLRGVPMTRTDRMPALKLRRKRNRRKRTPRRPARRHALTAIASAFKAVVIGSRQGGVSAALADRLPRRPQQRPAFDAR